MKFKVSRDWEFTRKQPEYPIFQFVRKHLDPCAVVAGGRALQLAYGVPTNDVDIYFTSLYTFKSVLMRQIRKSFKQEFPALKVDWTGNPKYGNGIELMGTVEMEDGLKVQIIWAELDSIPSHYYARVRAILDTFDMSICKVAIDYSYTNLGNNARRKHRGFGFHTITTDDFCQSLKTKDVIVSEQLSDYQQGKTLETRVPKYKKRFKGYSFLLNGKKI